MQTEPKFNPFIEGQPLPLWAREKRIKEWEHESSNRKKLAEVRSKQPSIPTRASRKTKKDKQRWLDEKVEKQRFKLMKATGHAKKK